MEQTEKEKIEEMKKTAYKHFTQNLHLFYNRPNLLRMDGFDGHPYTDAMTYKGWVGDVAEKQIETILERLKEMFHRLSNTMEGGGMNLTQLKRKIRERVHRILPR